MKLRPVALLAAALTAGSLAVAVPAAAAPGAVAPLPGGRPHPTRTIHQSKAQHGRLAALSARLPRSITTRPASKLDPATRTLPTVRGGKVHVTVRGDAGTVAASVRKLDGTVLVSSSGTSSVLVPKTKLTALSTAAGVTAVRKPVKAYPMGVPTSEGVQASGAQDWQGVDGGAGVSVAIVDDGFTDALTQIQNGGLPANTTIVNEDCTGPAGDPTATDQHGTAVADIVNEMAPAAKLYLYCIQDTVGFAAAESAIVTAGTSIATSSLGFPGDARGDGTGSSGSAADTVRKARRAGVLWIQSAGNEAADHWSGKLTDADDDGLIDMDGTDDESDEVSVEPGNSGEAVLQWDQWPVSSAELALDIVGFQCSDANCTADPSEFADPNCDTSLRCEVQTANSEPVLAVDIPANTSGFPQIWVVEIQDGTALPSTRYDITYQGDVDPSFYASEIDPDRAAAGSMASPADSPYAFAVGAADVGADGQPQDLEFFSSRGPTIDGRAKPDITGWDGVSSPEFGPASTDPNATTGFYGTSAAAPHVAGAAALVKSANTGLDAAQIQNFLEQRANHGAPTNPAVNSTGHGLLTLGATPAQTPVLPDTGSRYTPVTPKRILDTRNTTGGHHARLGAKAVLTLTVPGLPADATAVAINLTGTGVTAPTYLTAYPAGATTPIASNVNLSKTDSTAASFTAVTLGAGHKITIYNRASTVNVVVDLLGYFGTGAEQGRYTPLTTPTRVLDTRSTIGGHHAQVAKGGHVTVTPQAPSGSTAAIVNIAATRMHGGGSVSAAPACTGSVSTVNFQKLTRSNLAVVGLDANRRFCVQNNATGPVDIVVDVVGFLGTTGSEYHALAAPQRIVDTRYGNGGSGNGHSSGGFFASTTKVFYGANVGDVPASAQALLASVTEASGTADGYLTAFPGASRPAGATSTVNFTAGRVVANAAVIGTPASGTGAHEFGLYNATGTTQAVVDLFGYFAPPFVSSPGSTGTR